MAKDTAQTKPKTVKAALIMSVVQLVAAVAIHIRFYTNPLLLAVLGTVTLVLTIVAYMMWDAVRPLRIAARAVGGLAAGALIAWIVALAVQTILSSMDTVAVWSDEIARYVILTSLFLLIQSLQVLAVFALPIAVAAASFGGKLDRILMRGIALVNTACVAQLVLDGFSNTSFSAISELLDGVLEYPAVLYVYAIFSTVVLLFTFVPAFRKGTDLSPKE